jgi:hypothetical protein
MREKPSQEIDVQSILDELMSCTDDESLAKITACFDSIVDQLAEPVMPPRAEVRLFRICVAGLELRRMLNPRDNNLALGIAALALTRAVLAKRAAKCDEKVVSA